ncbi:MAG: glycosyltransferase family 4 protein [Nanoarchaeota archaeon]|nr:glycosyltransferase family 4 protein [Nanoarchaeota archaeon]
MTRKLCVFSFSYAPNKKAMLDYLEKIFPREVEMFLFTTKEYAKDFEKCDYKKIKVLENKSNRLTSFFYLRKFCKENSIDRIINIGTLPYEAFPMIFSSIFTKTETLVFHLGNPIECLKVGNIKNRIYAIFEAFFDFTLSLFPKKILLCTKELTNDSKKILFFSKNKIFYLAPTIPTSFFKPLNKQKTRKKLGFKTKDKIIIFAGRVHYLKGSDFLIDAIKNNPDKKFIVIGKIIDKKFLKEKFENIIHIESLSHEELVKYYNISDLCLFPSRLEGLALVPREAMSCSTPAIVLDNKSFESIEKTIKVPAVSKEINRAIDSFFNLSKKQINLISKDSRDFIIKEYDDLVWKDLYVDYILN